MSTTELFLEPDIIEEFIELTTEDDELITFGEEDDMYGVCPYASFYIYHGEDEKISLAEKMVELYEEFATFIDKPFKKVFKSSTQVWLGGNDKRLPNDLLTEATKLLNDQEDFWLGATDRKTDTATPRWSIYGCIDKHPALCYATIKFIFYYPWYKKNQTLWNDFINRSIEVLQPEQCYSGFEVSSGPHAVMGNYEAETMERVCVDYFYGLDIDHPMKMGFHYHDDEDGYVNASRLGAGIRTPTWCFMLSPIWLSKLGKTEEQVRAELDDPRVTITAFPYPVSKHNPEGANALWIQLGELDLHPVGNGKPELLIKANKLIQPIRCDQLGITTLDAWDDDPNPRFDEFSSVAWMRRFDDDENWLLYRAEHSPLPLGIYEAKPGETVPKAGYWYAPTLEDKTEPRYFEAGQQLPFDKTNEEGDEVTWYRQIDSSVDD